jgi:subtilisin family serine protease
MKRFRSALFLSLVIFTLNSFAQNVQFSASTKSLVSRISNPSTLKSTPAQVALKLQEFYPVRIINDQIYVGAMMLVVPDIDLKALENLGIQINTRVSNIWTAQIPLHSIEKLKEVKGLRIVDVSTIVKPKLDNATKETRVKEVQAGTGVVRKFLGDSVIVGIVDHGFDYTHPTFYDTTGANLRILRSWDQGNDKGNTPDGFTYGSEFVGTTALLSQKYSNSIGHHGTHVAGIAAGSGCLTPDLIYMGVAPAASLIFVDYNNTASMIDAVKYIFQNAAILNRKAVVNLSQGSHIGPHDGTSLTDQSLDSLVGPGKIIVGAAGNEADTPLHLGYQFNNDTIRTFVDFENPEEELRFGAVDQWGSANSDFAISLLFTTSDMKKVWSTQFYAASSDRADSVTKVINGDSLNYIVTGVKKYETNNKPNLLVQISQLKKKYLVTLIVTSKNSFVNIWNHGRGLGAKLYDTLSAEVKVPGYRPGDINTTVGEIGGTSKKIITVGAYVTRNQWITLTGKSVKLTESIGQLAPWSSRGPTADGRIKPEITAPGMYVFSSYNSAVEGLSTDDGCIAKVTKDGKTWYFGSLQGTSMSCPMVTGIVALMLQANPLLGPERVKEILQKNARTDSFTGPIGPDGNNDWGWGKVDALQSVAAAYKVLGIEEEMHSSDISAYPNPSGGIIYLVKKGTNGTNTELIVRNMIGSTVYHQTNTRTGSEPYRIDLSALPAGLYIVTVKDNIHPRQHIKISLTR